MYLNHSCKVGTRKYDSQEISNIKFEVDLGSHCVINDTDRVMTVCKDIHTDKIFVNINVTPIQKSVDFNFSVGKDESSHETNFQDVNTNVSEICIKRKSSSCRKSKSPKKSIIFAFKRSKLRKKCIKK